MSDRMLDVEIEIYSQERFLADGEGEAAELRQPLEDTPTPDHTTDPTPPPKEAALESAKQKAIDAFDDHLGVCLRCETQPFNLCPIGHELLIKAAASRGPLDELLALLAPPERTTP